MVKAIFALDNNNIIGIIIKSVLSGQSFRIRKVSRCPETNSIEIIKQIGFILKIESVLKVKYV